MPFTKPSLSPYVTDRGGNALDIGLCLNLPVVVLCASASCKGVAETWQAGGVEVTVGKVGRVWEPARCYAVDVVICYFLLAAEGWGSIWQEEGKMEMKLRCFLPYIYIYIFF